MALSRTARILIAVLLLAAAAFFWVNFFQRSQQVEAPAQPGSTTPRTGTNGTNGGVTLPGAVTGPNGLNGAAGVTAPADGGSPTDGGPAATAPDASGVQPGDAQAGQPAADGATQQDAGAPSEPGVVTDPATGADAAVPLEVDPEAAAPGTEPGVPGAAPGAAPVIVTDPPTVVLRDLVVEELPFLVTEPPAPTTDELAAEEADAERPVSTARANVNPFSPILVQTPPPAAAPVAEAPPASAEPDVVVVETGQPPASRPSGTGAPAATPRPPVTAPAPRAVAPAPGRTAELPRPLPSGTLSAVPDILRDARNQPRTPAGPADLGSVAAVVVPEGSEGAQLPFVERDEATVAAASPDVLGPGHAEQRAQTGSTLPLAVGADPLSRYLRDNNVRFTGQVLGPLSVGVFRSNLFQQPVVVTLGQTLPETEIVLADLRGYEAKFSLGTHSQVLSLDTRR